MSNSSGRERLDRRQLLAGVPLLLAAAPEVSAGQEVIAEVSGTVVGYDNPSTLLTVNTRLGRVQFLVRNTTVILLNNHSGTVQNITANDEVTVRFDLATRVAVRVHLTRESRQRGKVTNVTATALDLRFAGAVVSYRLDANSVVEMEQILLNNRAVLIGRTARVVYEPGANPLTLRVQGEVSSVVSTVTAVSTTDSTITVAGRTPRTFKLDPLATLRRSDLIVNLTALVVGDRVRVAFVKSGETLTALAVSARPAAT